MVFITSEIAKKQIEDNDFKRMMRYSDNHGDDCVSSLIPRRSERAEGFAPTTATLDENDFIIKNNELEGASDIAIDLRVGTEIYEADFYDPEFNPKRYSEEIKEKKLELGESIILKPDAEGGKYYYMPTHERIHLPKIFSMDIDAKSTTGRVGVMAHKVNNSMEGRVSELFGEPRRVWMAIQPYAFPIKITCGKTSLVHAVIRYARSEYMDEEKLNEGKAVKMRIENKEIEEWKMSMMFKEFNGVEMKYSTKKAFEARPYYSGMNAIDMNLRGAADPKEYFELKEGNLKLPILAKTFYLLGTQEEIEQGDVVGRLDRENTISGTGLWGHFAGYIMPKFRGAITLEAWSLTKRILRDGNSAGTVRFDELEGKADYKGSYQDQEVPQLPKVMASWED